MNSKIPDDVEAPEDTALPPTTGDGLPEETPETIKPDKKKMKNNNNPWRWFYEPSPYAII